MPSRRTLLTTFTTVATAGVAGCIEQIRDIGDGESTVKGPCDDPSWSWPTAGGDRGRTGQTDTSPPAPDANIVHSFGGTHYYGQQQHVSSLPVVGDGITYVPTDGGIIARNLTAPENDTSWDHDGDGIGSGVLELACGVVIASELNQLTAFDLSTGEKYWQASDGSGQMGSVAFIDETVYVAGSNPVAVNIHTGEVRWRAIGGDKIALGERGIYTTNDGLFAHNFDGEERWHRSLGPIAGSASVNGDTVWVATDDGTVYAIDSASGETYWSQSPDGVGQIISGLAVRGDDVVVPAGNGETSVVLDAATGEIRWTATTGTVIGRPVVGDDWVAIGTATNGVSVYNRETGEKQTTWPVEHLGTVGGLVPIEEGFLVYEDSSLGLSLLR